MKKYHALFFPMAMLFIVACGSTTDKGSEVNKEDNAADSAVGNSAAANTIYRDSADIKHGTESSGGTGNPSGKADSADAD